jgi:hypothetical protein
MDMLVRELFFFRNEGTSETLESPIFEKSNIDMTDSGKTKYQKQLKGTYKHRQQSTNKSASSRREGIDRIKQRDDGDLIDSKFGFQRYIEVISV